MGEDFTESMWRSKTEKAFRKNPLRLIVRTCEAKAPALDLDND